MMSIEIDKNTLVNSTNYTSKIKILSFKVEN